MVYYFTRERSILGIGDIDEEEENNYFEESPPFINSNVIVEEYKDVGYMSLDHIEGYIQIFINRNDLISVIYVISSSFFKGYLSHSLA